MRNTVTHATNAATITTSPAIATLPIITLPIAATSTQTTLPTTITTLPAAATSVPHVPLDTDATTSSPRLRIVTSCV